MKELLKKQGPAKDATGKYDVLTKKLGLQTFSDDVIHSFAESLRRVLYLQTILLNEIEWCTGIIPGHTIARQLNVQARNLEAQRRNVKQVVYSESSPGTVSFFEKDLSKDQLHAIANIIHHCADLSNVDGIESMVRKVRKAAEQGHTQQGLFIFETVDELKLFVVEFCNHWALHTRAKLSAGDEFDYWIDHIYRLREKKTVAIEKEDT